MSSSGQMRLKPPPSLMDRKGFVARFGEVYEHSPWVAERVWDQGVSGQHDLVDGLHASLKAVVAEAGQKRKLALVRAHPDLAGRAAVRGELTDASSAEQAGAGLDRCTAAEFDRFQALNRDYKERFGFPFIIAVRGLDRKAILHAFEERLGNEPDAELIEALRQIDLIALLRLEAMAEACA